MEFPVPQFIDIEEKILGPLGFKQTIYLVGAGAVLFILYFFVELQVFIVLAVLIGGSAGVFAFARIGGKSFGTFLSAVFAYTFSSRVFIWKKTAKDEMRGKTVLQQPQQSPFLGIEGEAQKVKTGSTLQTLSKKVDLGIDEKISMNAEMENTIEDKNI